jgi:hypothetical protein
MIIDKSADKQENDPDYKGKTTLLYRDNDTARAVRADYNDCRWIDVVQLTTNPSNTQTIEKYSRLAFK